MLLSLMLCRGSGAPKALFVLAQLHKKDGGGYKSINPSITHPFKAFDFLAYYFAAVNPEI
jgi:hypothetical protein